MIRKQKIGFAVVDMILLVLALSCVLSAVFQDQLRSFFGQEKGQEVEITFLVENVTQKGKNHPVAGEEILLTDTNMVLGTILSVTENKTLYQNTLSPDDTLEIASLTCKAVATLEEDEAGYTLSGVSIKPGAYLAAHTPTASFVMMITMVKPNEK